MTRQTAFSSSRILAATGSSGAARNRGVEFALSVTALMASISGTTEQKSGADQDVQDETFNQHSWSGG